MDMVRTMYECIDPGDLITNFQEKFHVGKDEEDLGMI